MIVNRDRGKHRWLTTLALARGLPSRSGSSDVARRVVRTYAFGEPRLV